MEYPTGHLNFHPLSIFLRMKRRRLYILSVVFFEELLKDKQNFCRNKFFLKRIKAEIKSR